MKSKELEQNSSSTKIKNILFTIDDAEQGNIIPYHDSIN